MSKVLEQITMDVMETLLEDKQFNHIIDISEEMWAKGEYGDGVDLEDVRSAVQDGAMAAAAKAFDPAVERRDQKARAEGKATKTDLDQWTEVINPSVELPEGTAETVADWVDEMGVK